MQKVHKNKTLPTREVNRVILNLMKGNQWNMVDFALKIDLTIDQLENHFDNDSDNSFIIARCAEGLGLPTQPSSMFLDRSINKEMKRQMEGRGLTYKDLARKMLPKEYKEDYGWMVDRLQNFIYTQSTDSWMIARMCEIYRLKTMPSAWFLNTEDVEKLRKKRQLELAI